MPSTSDNRFAGIVRLVIPTGKVITVSPIIGESQSLYKRKPKFLASPKSLLSDKVKSLFAVCTLLISNLYQPVFKSDKLMVLVQSNKVALSQPSGVSG